MHNYYISGEWNLICDVCGKKVKAHKARHRWDGFVVCPSDFEQRHSQDFVRARQDKISVPYTRPRPTDVFIDVPYIDKGNLGYCTITGMQAVPSWGIPGCMIQNKNTLGI